MELVSDVQQQLHVSIESPFHNHTMYTCEVTVALASGPTTIARSTDVLSFFMSK